MVGYATIYTQLPVFSLVLDKDVTPKIAMDFPELYKELTKGLLQWGTRGWCIRGILDSFRQLSFSSLFFPFFRSNADLQNIFHLGDRLRFPRVCHYVWSSASL